MTPPPAANRVNGIIQQILIEGTLCPLGQVGLKWSQIFLAANVPNLGPGYLHGKKFGPTVKDGLFTGYLLSECEVSA